MLRPHLHGELELLFPLTDGDQIFIDNISYPLRRGRLYLMDAGVPHRSRFHGQQAYDRCILHFPLTSAQVLGVMDLPELLAAHGCCVTLSEEEFSRCRRLFDRLLLQQTTLTDSLHRIAAFAELLALMVDKWCASAPPSLSAADPVMASVVSHIRAHLAEDLSLDTLAAQFYLSKSALCHRFKAATGFTVTEYIILWNIMHTNRNSEH